jgi:hypothetical protein
MIATMMTRTTMRRNVAGGAKDRDALSRVARDAFEGAMLLFLRRMRVPVQRAAKKTKVIRHTSEFEETWLVKLVDKYGDDVATGCLVSSCA